ncbi:hypothetical protein [Pontibacter burrus]|uniref:Uncharacterized protein n=1 Tax=Pontibacter burrus TaxID=2704466 RepID=A0A6B3M269_9BACT|nr:hypothetical protein [Pontibacter burrus]NEM99681.1 hypothetical protein [Pontibacter burrus]
MHYLLFILEVVVELSFTYPERWDIKYKRLKNQYRRRRARRAAQHVPVTVALEPDTQLQSIAA